MIPTDPTQKTGNPTLDPILSLPPESLNALISGVDRHIASQAPGMIPNPKPQEIAPPPGVIASRPSGASPSPTTGAIATQSAVPSSSPTPPGMIAPTPLQTEVARITKPPLASTGPLAHTPADTGRSGIGQIHNPWARVPLQVADAIGTAFVPSLTAGIPGTELHHERVVGDTEAALENEQGQRAAETKDALQQAQTEEAKAHAASFGAKPTDEWVELKEPVTDPAHPEVGPQSAFFNKNDPTQGLQYGNAPMAAKPAEPKEPKEGEQPIGDRVGPLNEMLTARYQILHPGEALPAAATLPKDAKKSDFDRIDKLMEATERAAGTLDQQNAAKALRDQSATLANQAASERATTQLDKEIGQFVKPFEDAHKAAADQLSRILDAQVMIAKDSPEAIALAIPKVMTALVSGQGTGVRITQPELNMIAKARGLGGDFQAAFQKLTSGKSLTPEQRKDLSSLMDDIQARVQAKAQIASRTEDRIKGAKARPEIVQAEKEGRAALDFYEKDPGVKDYADQHFGGDIVAAVTAIQSQKKK